MRLFFDWLHDALAALSDALWAGAVLVLDGIGDLGSLGTGAIVLAVAALLFAAARLMQSRLIRRLAADPRNRLGFVDHEIWFFLPAWLFLPFALLWRGLKALWHWLTGLFRDRTDTSATAGETGPEEEAPYLAATLGPSFLLGGLVTALLYVAARVVEPLVATRLGLSPGVSAWEYLFFGRRPELAPYLPLGRNLPFLAAFTAFLLWGTVWWWLARLVRAFHWRHLGGDLRALRDDPAVLPVWRRWAAVRHLVRPALPYRRWAGTSMTVALPLAAWAWFTLADAPYRVAASDLAVALVVCLGWLVHLTLHGAERRSPEVPAEDAEPDTKAFGWPEVCADLEERLQIATPQPLRPPRPSTALPFAPSTALEDPLLSPLLGELVPGDGPATERRLLPLQREELLRLSRLGHVFTQPPAPRGELLLGDTRDQQGDGVHERNRIVLAPEGYGKTTLAVLAAANHALVHTRTSLLVVRDEEEAAALHERIRRPLDRSTLRWTLRVRRVGDDLVDDLTRGIVPDIVVASLHHLTATVLDRWETYAPLLRSLGLIVVDDIESFAGAVETHGQLAFRRLSLAARKLLAVDHLGDEAAPLLLALGCNTMHQAPLWVKALLGEEAEVETHGAEPTGSVPPPVERSQVFYRLHDFRSAAEERLDPVELIESCERRSVAWHYRTCSDGQRNVGRASLYLSEDPECFTEDPADAAVVLLDGSWSEVRREIARLPLAGSRHPRSPCAIVTLGDPDIEMAFTQHDPKLALAGELAALPRPVLRPPTGRTVARHLAADLTQSWTEVADVLHTFGNGSAHTLRELAEEGLLLSEQRTDVQQRVNDYEEKVYVRALANAVAETRQDEDRAPLPPKVVQVELASERAVSILDRTDLDHIATVDADSAGLAFYPGRVFSNARGRFVVVHHARQEGGRAAGTEVLDDDRELPEGTILVEPLLGDDVSSPRRRIWIDRVLATGHPGRKEAQRRAALESVGDDEEATAPRSSPPDRRTADDPIAVGHSFYGPDPLRIGEHRIEVELALVELRARHFATYLLGPAFCEVRQRRLFDERDGGGEGGAWETSLASVALCIYPNPDHPTGGDEARDRPPTLCLNQARLVAAAMRAVLPSIYRGAGEGLDIGIHLDPRPDQALSPDYELNPWDCFVLFDLHAMGNGTARALHRDGVELLLRLSRLLLERVLYHDRLLALHDHWATSTVITDLYADDGATRPSGEHSEPKQHLRERREQERRLRHETLAWLDSRLRPEGDAAAFSGALGRSPFEAEHGEGDVIDIGRCWYRRERSVADLVWVKHRWRGPVDEEHMVDIGFDRELAEEARRLDADSPLLSSGREHHLQHLSDPAFAMDDGSVWGEPGAVWRVEGEENEPHSAQAGAGDPETVTYHAHAAALAAYSWLHIGPLARKLAHYSKPNTEKPLPSDEASRHRLASFLSAFVQGIPTVRPDPDAALTDRLRPAIPVLLERCGDLHAKSLLLATLLQACGIPSGLALSRETKRCLVMAALPDPVAQTGVTITVYRDEMSRFASPEDSTGEPEHHRRGTAAARRMYEKLESWSSEVHLNRPPRFWCELPVRQQPQEKGEETHSGDGEGMNWLFVPIDTSSLQPVGAAALTEPTSWVFLPLVSVFHSLPDLLATDRERAEHAEDAAHGEEERPR